MSNTTRALRSGSTVIDPRGSARTIPTVPDRGARGPHKTNQARKSGSLLLYHHSNLPNFANPAWTPVSTNTLNTLVGTNGTSYFSDPNWTNYPRRFLPPPFAVSQRGWIWNYRM